MGKANMSYQREPKLVKPCSEGMECQNEYKMAGKYWKIKEIFSKITCFKKSD